MEMTYQFLVRENFLHLITWYVFSFYILNISYLIIFYTFLIKKNIVKLEQPLQPSQSPIKLGLIYIAILPEFDTGIFEFQFGSQYTLFFISEYPFY